MTTEQIDNFNKRSFPYRLLLKGKNIHLQKLLLDNLTERPETKETNINLSNALTDTLIVMNNNLLHSLFVKNDVLYINIDHD